MKTRETRFMSIRYFAKDDYSSVLYQLNRRCQETGPSCAVQ